MLVPLEKGADGLAESLGQIMEDDLLRESMGKEALSARDRFSMSRIAGQWDDVLAG